jgi:RNA polymerase sigma-70 factor (ECF subfamily)
MVRKVHATESGDVEDAVHGPRTDAGPVTAEPQRTDQEVVARINAGDVSAFEELYRRYASALLGYAYSQLSSREMAEDVVQELFLALWQYREKWDIQRSVKSYLLGALRNHIVSYRRRLHAREGRLRRVSGGDATLAALPAASRADHRVREGELAAAIEKAIEEIGGPRCRETFLLVRQQNLSYAEAAEVLGISVKGVEANMVRALAALRERLAPWRE